MARSGAVDSDSTLHVGRSWVRFPMVSLEIFHWHNSSGRTMILREMSTRNIAWRGKGGRCVGLTTLPSACADYPEIWAFQLPGSFWHHNWPGQALICLYLLQFVYEIANFCNTVVVLSVCYLRLTHWGRVVQICVFNTRLFSLHNTLNYAIHRACLRMVLLTDVYRNLTSLWINL